MTICRGPIIVVVDNDPDAARFLSALFQGEGYPVAVMDTGLEALSFVAKRKPPLVITEGRLPDLDGVELLSKIKFVSPDTKVIVLTAHGDEAMYLETIENGGEDLLLKPCTNDKILNTVRKALS